uniref:BTB domain-containing protein n=1 Tax=Rhodosorus marinus TaxID=101924 RepID=A0A7S3A4B1_9RHOD|mmetsp:Transcript_44410/g.172582  ORF Transcript_44410/g.172582 Transcript_44410/m.172582 type:complete len:538 (+) Transcript_44410:180-1793(+)
MRVGGRRWMPMDYFDSTRWKQLDNRRPGSVRSEGTDDSGSFPSRRWGPALFWHEDSQSLHAYGGEGKGDYLNDLCVFNEQFGWSEVAEVEGDPPPSSFGFSGTYDAEKQQLYVYGGFDGAEYLGGLVHVLDVSVANRYSWSSLTLSGDVSVDWFRCSHGAALLDGHLFIFGGVNEDGYSWRPFSIDLASGDTTALQDYWGLGRRGHAAVTVGERIYIVGGEHEGYHFFDLMQMDCSGELKRFYRGQKFARQGHSLLARGEKLYVFGGFNGEYLNDVVLCDLDTGYIEVQYPCTEGGPGPTGRSHHGAAIVENGIYVFAGANEEQLNDLFFYEIRDHPPDSKEQVQSLSLLGLDFARMVDSELLSDVVLVCDDGSRVFGHRFMLSLRSPYFARMFSSRMKESVAAEVNVPGVSRSALLEFVNYLYSGHLPAKRETLETTIELINLADLHGTIELLEHCKMAAVLSIAPSTLLKRLEQAEDFGLRFLRDACVEYIVERYRTQRGDEDLVLKLPQTILEEVEEELERRRAWTEAGPSSNS